MPARRTIAVAVCAAAAAAATLTGCNGDDEGSGPLVVPAATTAAKAEPYADLTAAQLLKKAERDMRDAGALTYDLSVREDGSPLRVKASVTSGGRCVAAMGTDEGKAQFIVPGGKYTYIKGDDDFWEGSVDAVTVPLLSGKWLRVPASEYDEGDLSGMCDLDTIMEDFTEDDGTATTKGRPTTLDGKLVIPLTVTDEDDGTATVYISTGATPYVVKMVVRGGDEPGFATFTDFGKEPRITVPPRSRTVDPKDLGPGSVHI